VRIFLKGVQADGNGLHDFLQNIVFILFQNFAVNHEPEERFKLEENFIRQPEAVGDSGRQPVGADKCDEVGHRFRKA
jgi:hypothetical protein